MDGNLAGLIKNSLVLHGLRFIVFNKGTKVDILFCLSFLCLDEFSISLG